MKLRYLSLAVVAILGLSACGSGDAPAPGQGNSDQSGYSSVEGLEALIAAAQKEGAFTFYYNPDNKIIEPVLEAFSKEFGITTEGVRLSSGDFTARYQAEAEANADVADAILLTTTVGKFWEDMLAKGSLKPVADAGIPEFPKDIDEQWLLPELGAAVVTLNPNGLAYNSDEVKANEAPEQWSDLADPRWKGQVALTDPRVSNSYVDFFYMIQQEYGDDVVRGIGANAYRYVASAVPLGQILGAGEALVGGMTNGGAVGSQVETGLPLAINIPNVTNGVEQAYGINGKAPHPSAAALFAWFVWYGEGRDILIASPLTTYISQTDQLPSGYTRVPEGIAAEHKAEILELLGLK